LFAHISSSASTRSSEPEKSTLTTGDASPPAQSTPPQTPRTRSHEDQAATGSASPPAATRSIPTDGTTIGPVLGKLTIVISEGRALRPSVDPYVVCDFQQSQYISDGPVGGDKRDVVKKAPSNTASQNAADRRRPMAIPMRSRQSSSSGREVRAQAREVTNPRWDHKAVL
jgi:protein-serine/threonine kinase